MSSSQAPVVDRIRIIPRPDDFLDRNVGSSGEVFYDKQANTLRVYSGKLAGGYTLLTSANISQQLADAGIAVLERVVTVGIDSVSGNASGVFYIDGTEKPTLDFVRGFTYIFDQSDSSNLNYASLEHPLMFSTTENGELAGGSHYNDGVIYLLDDDPVSMAEYVSNFKDAISRKVIITVKTNTPDTLYYWCHYHLNQGNSISVADPGSGSGDGGGTGASVDVSDTAPTSPEVGNIWFNSSNGKLYVYISDADSNQWVQPSVSFPTGFAEIELSGADSTSIVAGSSSDTLTLAEGAGISIQLDGISNTITFSATGGGISILESLSVTQNPASGNGSLTYDDQTGVFTYTPPVEQDTLDTVLTRGNSTTNDITVGDVYADNLYASTVTHAGVGPTVFSSASSLTFEAPDDIIFANNTLFRGTLERITFLTGAIGTVVHDFSESAVFYHTGGIGNFNANFTNVPTENGRAITVAVIMDQGASAALPTAVLIDGTNQTVQWQDAAGAPTGNVNQIDIVNFTFIRNNNAWTVLGSSSTYG